MIPRQHQSPDRRRLAAALRELREGTGLSAERFGAPLGWSQGKVSKTETGRTVPSPEDVTAWAVAAGASEDRAAELCALAERAGSDRRKWGSSRHGSLAARTEAVGILETRAEAVRVFQPSVIPGLLQTADYARHLLVLLGTDERDLAAAVNARMQRQDVLYGPPRPFEFVVTEGTLRWRPGSPQMMAAQLDRVLSVATLPNVDVRILPFDMEAPALYVSEFTIFEIPDDPQVLMETLTSESFERQESILDFCRAMFVRCQQAALAGDDAADMIRALRRELIPD